MIESKVESYKKIEHEMERYKDMNKDIYGVNELELERLFKEKGFNVFPNEHEKDKAKEIIYYESKTFNNELYKKLTIYEKVYIRNREIDLDENYKAMVLARRCLINGEKFKPYKNQPDEEQPNIEKTANGVYFGEVLNNFLKLEYVLKQKYNEEGDK